MPQTFLSGGPKILLTEMFFYGDWTIFLVEVRGCEGRCVTVLVNDPETVPAKGEKVKILIWVTKTGDLRQAKNVFESF
jgi:hypothetical protein